MSDEFNEVECVHDENRFRLTDENHLVLRIQFER